MDEENKIFISELYERNSRALYNIAYTYIKNPDDAQDIVEDIFVTALKKARQLYGYENPDGWLYKTLYYKLKEYYRGRITGISAGTVKAVSYEDIDIDEAAAGVCFEDGLVDKIAFCEFLASLPVREREYIIYRYIIGMKIKEIADKMGVSQGAVKQLWQRAKKKLKKIFNAP